MSKTTLATNFQDDELDSSMGGLRRYKEIQNSDGTVSFEDVTDYTQIGSTFGASQINAINKAVNNSFDASKVIDDYDTLMATTQSGYAAGALAVKELNSNLSSNGCGIFFMSNSRTFNSNNSTLPLIPDKYLYDKNYYTFSDNTITVIKSGNYIVCGANTTGYANIALSVNGFIKIGKGAPTATSDTFTRNFVTRISLSEGDICKVIATGTAWDGTATGFSSNSYFSIAAVPS